MGNMSVSKCHSSNSAIFFVSMPSSGNLPGWGQRCTYSSPKSTSKGRKNIDFPSPPWRPSKAKALTDSWRPRSKAWRV